MFCNAVCPHGYLWGRSNGGKCQCDTPKRGRSRRYKYDGFSQKEIDLLKRQASGMTHHPADDPFEDTEFLAKYPTLSEYLFQGTWEDGTIRQTATLMFFAEGVVLKGVLNDRAFNRSAFASSSDFAGLLMKFEDGLATNKLDWRVRKGYNGTTSSTPF